MCVCVCVCVCVCACVCVCVVCVCNNTMSVWVKFASILDLATTARNSSTPTRQPQSMHGHQKLV